MKVNRLNDLDASSWFKFQVSWFIHNPPRGDSSICPAKFPDALAREFIEFFTKKGQIVLDPMVGTGSTLVACVESERNGIGVELLPKNIEIMKSRIEQARTKRLMIDEEEGTRKELDIRCIQGDAREIDQMNLPTVDYVITSPPYWNVFGDTRSKGPDDKGYGLWFSDDPRDITNIATYDLYINELFSIYSKVFNVLKPKGYLTIILRSIKKEGTVYHLPWDLSKSLSRLYKLKDEKIWCSNPKPMGPLGMGNAWVGNVSHAYCLIFRKES